MTHITLGDEQQVAYRQGQAYEDALDLMKQIDTHASAEAGDYKITLAAEKAEGLYVFQPEGDLQWELPREHDNQHIEIAVQDKKDRRFIPYLSIRATVLDKNNTEVSENDLPFLWHPFLYHYGANIHLLEAGEFSVRVIIRKPQFDRHDQDRGTRYADDITVTLGPIHMNPGRKEYGTE